MLRAVPATIFIACSTSRAFRSSSFVSAIWRTCACVRRPTFSRFGSPEPFSRPSASLIRTAAGGVFVMNVKDRSSKTVISTGMMRPFSCAVCALNALQNSMMLTPCWPSAGPTGGAGFAWPPGICSLINVRTFLAITSVELFDLVEGELHGHLTLEDVDEHVPRQHALLRLDLLALLRLDHLLGRDDDATEARRLVHGHDPVLEIGLHLVLVPGVGVDDVPAEHATSPYCPRKTFSTRRLKTRSDA